MKTNLFFLCIFAMGLFSITSCGASKSVAGDWNYTVTDLPDGNVSGIFQLTKEGKMYTGRIESNMGSADFNNIQLEDKKIKCNFSMPQAEVEMEGIFEGDTFKGKMNAAGYEFPVTAERVKKN